MRAEFYAIVTALCWSLGSLLEKRGLKLGDMPPVLGAGVRTAFSLVLLSALSWRYCNQNEYAAYRHQFLRAKLARSEVEGKTVRLTLRRPARARPRSRPHHGRLAEPADPLPRPAVGASEPAIPARRGPPREGRPPAAAASGPKTPPPCSASSGASTTSGSVQNLSHILRRQILRQSLWGRPGQTGTVAIFLSCLMASAWAAAGVGAEHGDTPDRRSRPSALAGISGCTRVITGES